VIVLTLEQVFAHENWGGRNDWLHNYRPDGGDSMIFDHPYHPKVTDKSDSLDEAKKYINATVAQLFYTSNLVHDLYYRYSRLLFHILLVT
jgi:extracellular elastinolytic metalloproteinase